MFRTAKKNFPDDVIPIIAANMDTVGTFEMAKVLGKVRCFHFKGSEI